MLEQRTPARPYAQINQTTRTLIQIARRLRREHRPGQLRSLAEIEEQPWNDDQNKIREIGQRLFERGGKDLMREVWGEIFVEDSRAANQISNFWEGVGKWFR